MSISRINQNVIAMDAYRNLSNVQNSLNNNVRHFSTGLRIESARDDATGLAISERFRAQITGYETANKNAQDANNMLQVADGAINETQGILQRLRQLAIIASNDATTNADRTNIQTETDQLLAEIDNIALTTQYNGRQLMNGSLSGSKSRKAASATISQNSYVNLSNIQGSINDSNKLINMAFLSSNSYDGEDLAIEIRLTANDKGWSGVGKKIFANVYMSNSIDSRTGEYYMIGSADITNDAPFSTEWISVQLSTPGVTLEIELNEANPTVDIGKVSYIKITNEQKAITIDKAVSFNVRANQGQTIGVSIDDMSASGLRIKKLNVSHRLAAQNSIAMIDEAITRVSTQRANIGALQQRLEKIISGNEINIINQRSAESRIRDVDFAQETLSYTRNNILINSGTAILAQANSSPENILSLLSG